MPFFRLPKAVDGFELLAGSSPASQRFAAFEIPVATTRYRERERPFQRVLPTLFVREQGNFPGGSADGAFPFSSVQLPFEGGAYINSAIFHSGSSLPSWSSAPIGGGDGFLEALPDGGETGSQPGNPPALLPPPLVPGVPEPGTWLMLLCGFALVGSLLRRHRRSALITTRA
jgi:hypothetical protein